VLGFNILSLFSNSLAVISTIIVIAYSTPIFLIVVVPMIVLYYFIQVRDITLVLYTCIHVTVFYVLESNHLSIWEPHIASE